MNTGLEIHDRVWQNLLFEYLKALPDELSVKPASSSGKHHPPKDNEVGGLMWHTRTTVRIADTMIIAMSPDVEAYDHIKFAAIIHDLGKYGEDGKSEHTLFEHPLVGAKMFYEFVSKKRLNEEQKRFAMDVVRLVERHHGRFVSSKYSKIVLPKAEKVDEMILHFADMCSARDFMDMRVDEHGLIPGEMPF